MPDLRLFSLDDPSSYMIPYIRDHFGDLLGPYAYLLDEPGGLDAIAALIREGKIGGAGR